MKALAIIVWLMAAYQAVASWSMGTETTAIAQIYFANHSSSAMILFGIGAVIWGLAELKRGEK